MHRVPGQKQEYKITSQYNTIMMPGKLVPVAARSEA
jgi:hypothetical protein